jgi:hypothetical protein
MEAASRMIRLALRALLALLVVLAAARAALFLAYAALMFGAELEAFHFEAVMVHLALRAQQGLPLYPDWSRPPHVTNPYGPLYFLAVGGLGRQLGATPDGLFGIGRLVTIGAALASAALVGWASAVRSGRGAGVVSGLLALASGPMIGFGVMVRPDIPAELLGLAGFLVAVGRPSSWRLLLGCGLMVSAIFAKQNCGLYLVAATAALALSGRRREAPILLGAGLVAFAAVVIGFSAVEPRFLDGLLMASRSPASAGHWLDTLGRLGRFAPELPLLAGLGLGFWASKGGRDVPLATLAVVLLVGSVASSAKVGSDQNYFLGLRLASAMAGGALWSAASRAAYAGRSGCGRGILAGWLGLTVLISVSLLPGLNHLLANVRGAQQMRAFESGPGRPSIAQIRRVFRLAADPNVELLTDSGLVALHQGPRATFIDPWLFRNLVTRGDLDPTEVRKRIENRSYDYIITTHDLKAPSYPGYPFGLPPELALAARDRYAFAGNVPGLLIYAPERRAD